MGFEQRYNKIWFPVLKKSVGMEKRFGPNKSESRDTGSEVCTKRQEALAAEPRDSEGGGQVGTCVGQS